MTYAAPTMTEDAPRPAQPREENKGRGGRDSRDNYAYPPAISLDSFLKKDKEEREKIVHDLWQMIEDGRQARKSGGRDDMTREWRDQYERTEDAAAPGPWEGSSKICTPLTRVAVDTVQARLVQSLFGSKPYLRVTPKRGIDLSAAKKVQDFIQSELESPSVNFKAREAKHLKDALIAGGYILKTCWKHEVRKVVRNARVTVELLRQLGEKVPSNPESFPVVTVQGKKVRMGEWVEIDAEMPTANHFEYVAIPLDDWVMFPATARTIDSARLVGHRVYKTMAQMRQGVKDGIYDAAAVRELEDENPATVSPSDDPDSDGGEDDSDYYQGLARNDVMGQDLKKGGYMEFYEVHAYFDADGDDLEEDCLFLIEMSRKKLIRGLRNPYHNGKRPFFPVMPDPRPHRFYGWSLCEKLAGLQMERDAITRMGLDAGTMSMSHVLEIVRDSRDSHLQTVFRPGITPKVVDEINQHNLISFPAVPSSNFYERAQVDVFAEKVSGAAEAAQGVAPKTARPLGETNIVAAAGAIRLELMSIAITEAYTWLYNQFFDYMGQFMLEGREFAIIRDGKMVWEEITPDELAIPCTVHAASDRLNTDESLRLQTAEKVAVYCLQQPQVASDLTRQRIVGAAFLHDMGRDDSFIDAVLGTDEEAERDQIRLAEDEQRMKEEQEAMAAQAMEAQQGMVQEQAALEREKMAHEVEMSEMDAEMRSMDRDAKREETGLKIQTMREQAAVDRQKAQTEAQMIAIKTIAALQGQQAQQGGKNGNGNGRG